MAMTLTKAAGMIPKAWMYITPRMAKALRLSISGSQVFLTSIILSGYFHNVTGYLAKNVVLAPVPRVHGSEYTRNGSWLFLDLKKQKFWIPRNAFFPDPAISPARWAGYTRVSAFYLHVF